MSAADEHIPDRDDDLTAAEYVLGVLPQEERRQATRRIEADPAFSRLVDRWEVRLSSMASAYEEVAPPEDLRQALDRRLFATAEARGARPGFWNSLAFWRGFAVASLAALAIVALLPFALSPGSAPAERLVASLAHDDTDVHYLIVYDARTADIGLSHVAGARAEGRDFELWVIEGSGPPVSLGVIPDGANVHLQAAEEVRRRIESGAVLAISLEPAGGSPTGQPTGPVVAAGDLKTI